MDSYSSPSPSPSPSSYWCYRCSRFVRVWTRDAIVCPDCEGGFIEEVENPPRLASPSLARLHPAAMYILGNRPNAAPTPPSDAAGGTEVITRRSIRLSFSEDRLTAAELMLVARKGAFELYYDDGTGSGLRLLPPSMSEILMGSGFDRLLDQLSQIEINGVGRCEHPPASKAAVESMPTIEITIGHFAAEFHCAVCMEQFELGSKAREMP